MRIAAVCATLALCPLITLAQQRTPEETGQAIYSAYLQGRHAAVLDMEKRCWAGVKAGQDEAASGCIHIVLGGGIMDQALARRQGRGPMPAFAPEVQRQRIMSNLARAGYAEAAATRVLQSTIVAVEPLMAGLMQAGMR